jgi:hypothetical protein
MGVFHDKASYHSNDNDNCHNWRIWGEKQPYEILENVWQPDSERVFWTSVWSCGSTFFFFLENITYGKIYVAKSELVAFPQTEDTLRQK